VLTGGDSANDSTMFHLSVIRPDTFLTGIVLFQDPALQLIQHHKPLCFTLGEANGHVILHAVADAVEAVKLSQQ
jgi:hypothetical protein